MGITYGNYSNVTANNAAVVIPKPTGLASGNLMIAHLSSAGTGTPQTWTPPSGWTSLGSSYNSSTGADGAFQTFWKTATSLDVSATDFSFSPNQGGGNEMGTIFYLTGQKNQAPTFNSNINLNSTAATTTGITPAADSMIILFGSYTDNDATQTQSGYSMVTSNPIWTERAEVTNAFGIYTLGHAFATGQRAESTSTGNTNITASAANDVYHSFILGVEPAAPVIGPFPTHFNN